MTDAEIVELRGLRLGYQAILEKNKGMCKIQAAGMKRLIELERVDAAQMAAGITTAIDITDPIPPWVHAANQMDFDIQEGALPDEEKVRLLHAAQRLKTIWNVVRRGFGEAAVPWSVSVNYHETFAVLPARIHWDGRTLFESPSIGGSVKANPDAMMRAINEAGAQLFGLA